MTASNSETLVQKIYPFFGLILFGLTWKLWTPQEQFPQISLISLNFSLPAWLEWCGFVGIFLGLVGSLFCRNNDHVRIFNAVFLCSLGVMFIDDTHRLQPWAWHLFLVAILNQVSPREYRMRLIIWLTASIYIFSGISKFDINFITGVGSYLLDGLLSALQVTPSAISDQMRTTIIWCFPIGELLIGLGLLWRRTFRGAIICSLGMHLVLLVTLGPLGLKHHWPVLTWNLLLITQNITFLLVGKTKNPATDSTQLNKNHALRLASCILMLALPILNSVSLWPHWLSWGLYSERISDVFIYISEESRDQLPVEVKMYVKKPKLEGNYCRIRTDRMSLGELNAPEFPQERFQIGVALKLAQKFNWHERVLVIVKTPPDRWTGYRDSREFSGQDDLQKLADENRL